MALEQVLHRDPHLHLQCSPGSVPMAVLTRRYSGTHSFIHIHILNFWGISEYHTWRDFTDLVERSSSVNVYW